MTIDFKALQDTIDQEIEAAANETSDVLAHRTSSLTRLTDEELKKLFPTPADVQQLKNLLEIIRSSEEENEKINRLSKNIQNLGGAAIKLLSMFA